MAAYRVSPVKLALLGWRRLQTRESTSGEFCDHKHGADVLTYLYILLAWFLLLFSPLRRDRPICHRRTWWRSSTCRVDISKAVSRRVQIASDWLVSVDIMLY